MQFLKKKFFPVVVTILIIVILGGVGYLYYQNISRPLKNSNILATKKITCFSKGGCDNNGQACFFINRYNYRIHEDEIVYSKCLPKCSTQSDCSDGAICDGGYTIENKRWTATNEVCQDRQGMIKELQNVEKFKTKTKSFDGPIQDGEIKEYSYSTENGTFETRIVLAYLGGAIDIQVLDSQGRFIGDNPWGDINSNGPKMPNAEYKKDGIDPFINIKNSIPDTYKIRILGRRIFDKTNYSIFIEENTSY